MAPIFLVVADLCRLVVVLQTSSTHYCHIVRSAACCLLRSTLRYTQCASAVALSDQPWRHHARSYFVLERV